MYTLLKPLFVREELLKRGVLIFTPLDFVRIFSVDKERAKYFLEKNTGTGLLLRLKRGVYALKSDMPGEVEIANFLYRPSYLSFEYALSFYSIIPEITYSITSATTKPTREFEVQGKDFSYLTIKKEAYGGYISLERDGRTFFIAEPEKALVDYLYFVAIGKKVVNDRTETRNLSKEKIRKYAKDYKNPRLMEIITEIL